MSTKTDPESMRILHNEIDGYLVYSLGDNLPYLFTAWLENYRIRRGITEEEQSTSLIAKLFCQSLESISQWEYRDADSNGAIYSPQSECILKQWRCLHSQVMVLAILNMRDMQWCAYCFPVPGINHEAETHLWQTEGSKLPEKIAKSMFAVPWVQYRR